MHRLLRFVVVPASLIIISGCASYRNTSLDSRLPAFQSTKLTLDGIKSAQTRAGQNPDVAFALAISGGGHRAANLATGILLGLESISIPGTNRNMLQEVDYFSTVSGGGFAAGTYISSLHDHIKTKPASSFLLSDALNENKERRLYNLRRDYQNSVLTQWVHWKCFGFRDGGDLMEKKFDLHLLGSKHRPDGTSLLLGDIFKPSKSKDPVLLPYWITNATVYENGDRFMFAPEFITHYRLEQYVHNMKYGNLNKNPFSLPMAVGMKASASFPVLFPASTFTCIPDKDILNPYLHLVDGGLTDNLGVQSAIELLIQDPAKQKILIVIDAYAKSGHPYSAHHNSPDGAGVAFRIMKMGLDSEHVRLHREVTQLAEENNINVNFFGFSQLKPSLQKAMEDVKAEMSLMRKQQRESLSRRLRRELDYALSLKQTELTAIQAESNYTYADASAVATNLKITQGEQAVLLRAGRTIVDRNKANLLQAITTK